MKIVVLKTIVLWTLGAYLISIPDTTSFPWGVGVLTFPGIAYFGWEAWRQT